MQNQKYLPARKVNSHSPYSSSLHYPSAPALRLQEPRSQGNSGRRKPNTQPWQWRRNTVLPNVVNQTSQKLLIYGTGQLEPTAGRSCGKTTPCSVLTSGAHGAQRTSLRLGRKEEIILSLSSGLTRWLSRSSLLGLVPGTLMVERENWLPHMSSDPTLTHVHPYTQNKRHTKFASCVTPAEM